MSHRPGDEAYSVYYDDDDRTVNQPNTQKDAKMTEFVARIKKGSRYYGQTDPGQWFDIEFQYRYDRFFINGPTNTYQLEDVDLGAKQPDGHIVVLNRDGEKS